MKPAVRTLHFAHHTSILNSSSVKVDTSQEGGDQRSIRHGSAIWGSDEDDAQTTQGGIWK